MAFACAVGVRSDAGPLPKGRITRDDYTGVAYWQVWDWLESRFTGTAEAFVQAIGIQIQLIRKLPDRTMGLTNVEKILDYVGWDYDRSVFGDDDSEMVVIPNHFSRSPRKMAMDTFFRFMPTPDVSDQACVAIVGQESIDWVAGLYREMRELIQQRRPDEARAMNLATVDICRETFASRFDVDDLRAA